MQDSKEIETANEMATSLASNENRQVQLDTAGRPMGGLLEDSSMVQTIVSNASVGGGRFQLAEPCFYAVALTRGLAAFQADEWATDVRDTEPVRGLGLNHVTVTLEASQKAVVEIAEGIAYVSVGRGRITALTAGKEPAVAKRLMERLKLLFPPPKTSDAQEVHVNFIGREFGVTRVVTAPTWEGIKNNYPSSVAQTVGALIERGSSQPGRLMLWHGLPGTGKTFALRALAWEWREWCDFEYIVDPEVFFGGGSEYMMETLLASEQAGQQRWRVLVAEDTGELLAKDAKSQMGQGLSRLLNVVDGLIGQSLPTMVLITTNEKLQGMDDAVTRPGRAGSIIEFQPFTAEEANRWLVSKGQAPTQGRKPKTLAELFNGKSTSSAGIGFASERVH